MPQVRIRKWRKNLRARLPGSIVRAAGLRKGERVAIEAQEGEIVIRRAAPRAALEGVFAGRSAEEWRAAYGEAFGSGAREAVEE